tara:strand:- start:3220 stop:3984 length:765 start_codon:yes stop_codon:yes gene_type:complete
MKYFVNEDWVVREIWGKSDTIIFIFAGASAEFALNKAVDWLYYTGKLPKDPLERLFSTVKYARQIVFSEKMTAISAIENINKIHATVELDRGKKIPDWACRDVLFMLIDYSIRSFEILERKLSLSEKEEVLKVFISMGEIMNISALPLTYAQYEIMRQIHLKKHLKYSEFSQDLYLQYRKHLGYFRFQLLLKTQIMITPKKVRKLLSLQKFSLLLPLLQAYKFFRKINLDFLLKLMILPAKYKNEINSLDHNPV